MNSDIKNPKLAESGESKIYWASREMPVLARLKKRMMDKKPFAGLNISACLHITAETANLIRVIQAGGAKVALCASNPLSTQDDVAAAIASRGVIVGAIKGEDDKTYYDHVNMVLDNEPDLTMDDGADLVAIIHSKRTELLKNVIGGTEETTTGVVRLRSLEKSGELKYPIIAVNDAKTKHFFDNRYGTGQSTLDGFVRATNVLLAGKVVVVCGYGWCGRGVATKAKGMGAIVIVTEIDPVKAIEAAMDGFTVMPIKEASKIGNYFITVTGNKNVIDAEDFEVMRDGAIMANSGHFNVEINIPALESMAKSKTKIRDAVEEYTMHDGRRLYILAEGRLINLSAAEGHPACVMDMSFSNQVISLEHLLIASGRLKPKVYPVPDRLDKWVAKTKLDTMGINIDFLTAEQTEYLSSWKMGM